MSASILGHPYNAHSVGTGQDHQGSMVATPFSDRPMGHARVDSGTKHTRLLTRTYRDLRDGDKTHTFRGTMASVHDHQGGGDTPTSDTNHVLQPDKVIDAAYITPPPNNGG